MASRQPSSVPVTVIREAGQLDAFAAALADSTALAVDTETNMRTGRLRVLSAATRSADGLERCWVVDGRDVHPPLLAPLLAGRVADGWNASFDAAVLDAAVFEPAALPRSRRLAWWDAMLADALVYQGRLGFTWFHGLAWAVERYLGLSAEGKGTTQRSFDATSDLTDDQVAYAAADAVETLWVADRLRALLTDAGLDAVADLEMRARPFLDEMSRRGFPFDADGYRAFLAERRDARAACLTELATLTGGGQGNLFSAEVEPTWNPASEPQAKAALNRFAAAEVAAYTGRTYGTPRPLAPFDPLDAAALGGIGGPLAAALAEHRHHAKLLGTYGDGLLAAVGSDGRIHPQYVQVVAAGTGRLASRNPNAQNLAPETAEFVRPPPGRVLVTADLSQAELRWMAQVAGDDTLRSAFAAGGDVHVATAERLFGVDMAELARTDPAGPGRLRQRAKALNFGILYGLGARALAQALTSGGQPTTVEEARDLLAAYRESHPGVARWLADHDRVVDRLAAHPPAVDWDATLRLLDELTPLAAERRAFRQRHDRWPSVDELLAALGTRTAALDAHRCRYLLGFEEPVVLGPDGEPIGWESRTLAGRRRRYDIGTWGLLRSASVNSSRREDWAGAPLRDEAAAGAGTALSDRGRPLPDPALHKAFDDRALRRSIIRQVEERFGRTERDSLLRSALSARIAGLANAHRNAPIQGGVADAMLAAYGLLWDAFADDEAVWPVQTVHDSIVVECPASRAAEVADAVRDAMSEGFRRFCPDVAAMVDVSFRNSIDQAAEQPKRGRDAAVAPVHES